MNNCVKVLRAHRKCLAYNMSDTAEQGGMFGDFSSETVFCLSQPAMANAS